MNRQFTEQMLLNAEQATIVDALRSDPTSLARFAKLFTTQRTDLFNAQADLNVLKATNRALATRARELEAELDATDNPVEAPVFEEVREVSLGDDLDELAGEVSSLRATLNATRQELDRYVRDTGGLANRVQRIDGEVQDLRAAAATTAKREERTKQYFDALLSEVIGQG